MNRISRLIVAASASGVTGAALADTLELYDGTLLEGDFVSSSKGIVAFNCECLSFSDTPVPNLSAQGK